MTNEGHARGSSFWSMSRSPTVRALRGFLRFLAATSLATSHACLACKRAWAVYWRHDRLRSATRAALVTFGALLLVRVGSFVLLPGVKWPF